jgi:hypothetical protein
MPARALTNKACQKKRTKTVHHQLREPNPGLHEGDGMAFTPRSNYLLRMPGAMVLCCLFAASGALARTDSDPVFFEAVKLPIGQSSAYGLVYGLADDKEKTSLLTFKPKANIASIRAAIANLEESGDLFSPALADYTAQLGAALQQDEQHLAALQAFDRSLQIMRRNEGLFSAGQISVLQAQIESQLALGNMVVSDGLYQARFSIQQQLYAEDSLKLAESFTALADWEIRYYLHDQHADWQTEEQRALLADRLADAFLHYHKALWNLSTSVAPAPYESKVAVERKIAAITLLARRR